MSAESKDGEKWLTRMLLLLPGFLSLGVARYIAGIEELEEFELTLYSLALSLVIFFLAALASRVVALMGFRAARRISADGAFPRPTLLFVALTLGLASLLGVAIAHAHESDSLLRLIRRTPGLELTTKRSSDRPLNLLLRLNRQFQLEEGRPPGVKQRQAWVRIVLDDATAFLGYPEFFGMGDEVSEIFLSPACSVNGAEVEPIPGPGVVVPHEHIQYLVFEDRESSACHAIWKTIARPDPVAADRPGSPAADSGKATSGNEGATVD